MIDRAHPSSSLDMFKGSMPLNTSTAFSAHNISAISHHQNMSTAENNNSQMQVPDSMTLIGRSSIANDQSFEIAAGQSLKRPPGLKHALHNEQH